ncbi:E3 ubiquitin-protein ligase Mdm2 isoform X1 [Amyelois transitella]|uniref:E3 ubiquitin-protein ligase Mdm2 isoform X1 n=1 Tax=Amyelois transitella TaxID=680683 RepID=UPI00298FF7BD|nr:E3 ubiquitin-protein ligase Mdm2 isoform X1 [Amyelois transitella]
MNSTAIATSAADFRRCSTETILSIQGRETDFVADTTDTESLDSDRDLEYEPASETDDDEQVFTATSGDDSEEEIIKTKVITVTMGDSGEVEFADSEHTDANDTDSEIDMLGFERCALCHSTELDSFYRYCDKCFKVRKNLFPPRPKRKKKRKVSKDTGDLLRCLSQDSGFESHSQKTDNGEGFSADPHKLACRKRRTDSIDSILSEPETKRRKSTVVQPLIKTMSEPPTEMSKISGKDNLCITCCVEPKSGVFAHGKIAHICCCYRCAVKIWTTSKRCPICNCKVNNVLRAVVM